MSEKLIGSRNPNYDPTKLGKYRLVYEGGQAFITEALKKYTHERDDVWRDRKNLAYNPAFAEEAVSEYSRAILQYQNDVIRVGGTQLYLDICKGEKSGVDGQGSSMNSFIGRFILDELLAMGSVGIYVDNQSFMGQTLADTTGHPYIYAYKAEDILNWSFVPGHPDYLRALLLRDTIETIDPDTQLPDGTDVQYRHMYLAPNPDGHTDLNYCHVDFYNSEGHLTQAFKLDIQIIPFILFQLKHSLLKNVCDHQAALLNLTSSTFFYAWGSNFPFYVEEYDPMYQDRFFENRPNDNPPDPESANTAENEAYSNLLDGPEKKSDKDDIVVGALSGRRVVKGLKLPKFINPSSEPMTASMSKEEQIKNEIRQLVALNVSSLTPKMASAESKALDREGLEAGLNFIGLTLELAERRCAYVFQSYTGGKKDTKITYPESYTLLTDQDRRNEASELKELQFVVPSKTYQKNVAKRIAHTMFTGSATPEELDKMDKEIEEAKAPSADPETLRSDHEAGFVSTNTASMARGYPKGEAEKAKKDHAARLAAIKDAQSPGVGAGNINADARGIEDEAENPGDDAKNEKTQSQNGDLDKGGRGEAK